MEDQQLLVLLGEEILMRRNQEVLEDVRPERYCLDLPVVDIAVACPRERRPAAPDPQVIAIVLDPDRLFCSSALLQLINPAARSRNVPSF